MPLPFVAAKTWTCVVLGVDMTITLVLLTRIAIVVGVTILAMSGVLWWVRQKIVWQKAALPYLSRLSRVEVEFTPDAPDQPGPMIEAYAAGALDVDGKATERPLLLLGPLGVGKTGLAAAIGTEAAFAGAKVRYVSFSKLAQSALAQRRAHDRAQAIDAADAGPPNILYWQWRRAQLVIVDDIRPGLGERDYVTLQEFRERFAEDRKLGAAGLRTLLRRRSVWAIGVTEAEESDWIAAFEELFGVPPLVARLRPTPRHGSGLEAIALRT
ncbi:MAG: AAA family ATPase [Alphaproteobacteria bacterium]|nr:AAA family ATPase [Alphaproteobacteria bacterium]